MSVRDFIALDVETANADYSSICSVGLVHFRGGEVFHSLEILVDPQDEFSPMNVSVHGIRPEDVVGKPTMRDVIPVIGQHLKGSVIVHHSPFDRAAIRKAAGKYSLGELPCHWVDTLKVARHVWRDFQALGGYGLKNLAQHFSFNFEHHRAAEDARVAGLILIHAMNETGKSIEDWVAHCDSSARYKGTKVARGAVADGPLSGEKIVFTGALKIAREDAATLAAQSGADIQDSVSKKTTILVVGDQDLKRTNGQIKSSKHRKAEDLMMSGTGIRIILESDFMLLID